MLLRVVWISCIVWAAKLLLLATADFESGLYWASFAFALALSMRAVVLLFRLAAEAGTFKTCLCFTFAVGLPFVPDTYLAVAHEAPGKAPLYTSLGFALAVLVFSGSRALLMVAVRGARVHGFLLKYVAFSLAEASVLLYAPLLHFGGVPIPVPPLRPWFRGDASAMDAAKKRDATLFAFVDPRLTEGGRLELSARTPEEIVEWLAPKILASLEKKGVSKESLWGRLVVVFPETFLNLRAEDFRRLWPLLAEELAPLVVERGEVEVFLGARYEAANVVYRGYRDALLSQPRGGVVHSKSTFVPFYEVPLAGLAVRDSDVSSTLDTSHPERLISSRSGSGWEFGSTGGQEVLVCYEAMNPFRWGLRSETMIFTNHLPFSRPGTASAFYDFTLRQVGRMTSSTVFLAANWGSAGIFGSPRDEEDRNPLAFVVVRLAAESR